MKENGIIHLWELPDEKVYVKLKRCVEKKLFSVALSIFITQKNLAKKLNVSQRTIHKLISGKTRSFSLKLLKKFSSLLSEFDEMFKLQNLERKVLYLRTKGSTSGKLFLPKFPMNFNCFEGGVIIGGILGDGGLRRDLRPFYTNSDIKRVKKFIRSLRKVVGKFKISGFTKVQSPTKKDSITYSYDFPKIVGIILHAVGLKNGSKIITDPPLPPFCFSASLEFKKGLLTTFFTDEGTPHPAGEDKSPQITFRQAGLLKDGNFPRRLLGIKILLEELGFKPVAFLEDSYYGRYGKVGVFNLSLSKLNDVIRFSEEIGFSSEVKKKKLQVLLQKTTRKNSAEEYFRKRRASSLLPILHSIQYLVEKNEEITSSKIATMVGRHRDSVKSILNKLVSLNVLELKEKGKPLNGKGHSCDVFKIGKCWRDYLSLFSSS